MPDETGYAYDVFISYSSHDKAWVRGALLEKIEAAGLRTFIDFRDFKPGAPSIKEMERGITDCRKTLVVLTQGYLASEWCEIEGVMLQTLSPANRDLRLIPLLKAPCDKPLRLSALTHIDFTDGADIDLAWRKLLTALEVIAGSDDDQPVPADVQAERDRAKSLMESDKHAEALPILEKALALADRAGHARAKVEIRLSLAHALHDARDDFAGAEKVYRDALALVPVQDHALKRTVLLGMGEMLLLAGRLDEAAAIATAVDESAKQSGQKVELAWSLMLQGHLEQALGFNPRAIAALNEAIGLFFQEGLALSGEKKRRNASALALCYLNKAALAREEGKIDDALAYCDKAAEQHRISEDRLDAGKALVFRGELHCAQAHWELGFESFRQAMALFLEIANPLWLARAAERIARMHAMRECWQEAVDGMLAAASGAAESGHAGEQVHFLCEAAALVRQWKRRVGRDEVLRHLHSLAKGVPKDEQAAVYAALSTTSDEMYRAVSALVRDDADARGLLDDAKRIAEEAQLPRHLANCLIDEAHQGTPRDDVTARNALLARAAELLKQELRRVQSPKVRGHLMGRISGLHQELGQDTEALSWLQRAGEVFEKAGDVRGLANYYGALGQTLRAQGRLDEEISVYRKALRLIEGRSFHHEAAGARLSLANALRFRKEYDEGQRLLSEAEAICEQYAFDDMISDIGSCRGKIEHEVQAAQAPTRSLPQLLESLGQLLAYKPDRRVGYLPFWYYAMQSELLKALRSGPDLSFMVVTDDVKAFMRLASTLHHVGDNFIMVTTVEPSVTIEPSVLAIPPTWEFPITFTFMLTKKRNGDAAEESEAEDEQDDKPLPRLRFVGPATRTPLFIPVEAKSDIEGEGHMVGLKASSLPQQAIDLMVAHPIEELVAQRAVWMAIPRHRSKDPFLTDLRVAHERAFLPVYMDGFPASDGATVCASVQVTIPESALKGQCLADAGKWRRALLKIAKLPKEQAQLALLDLPEAFPRGDTGSSRSAQVVVALFEFPEIDTRVVQLAMHVRVDGSKTAASY
jgi:tetratricopeptide (TPR) repeat protein